MKTENTTTAKKTLDELLEDISVMDWEMWDNETHEALKGWFAVGNDTGIIAYFGNEVDAFRFRLSYINSLLNPAT